MKKVLISAFAVAALAFSFVALNAHPTYQASVTDPVPFSVTDPVPF